MTGKSKSRREQIRQESIRRNREVLEAQLERDLGRPLTAEDLEAADKAARQVADLPLFPEREA